MKNGRRRRRRMAKRAGISMHTTRPACHFTPSLMNFIVCGLRNNKERREYNNHFGQSSLLAVS